MEIREKVKEFNQCFIKILNKFTTKNAPLHSLAIKYYTSTLILSIDMIFKHDGKDTLAHNFEEAKSVDKDLSSYDNHPYSGETKSAGKKNLLLTKSPEKEPKDINNTFNLVKKLSNEVFNLKKNTGERTSRNIPFHPFLNKNDNQPKPSEAPQLTLNLDTFGNDNFYSYHQQNHFEKTCPQWVNSMTSVINQLLDQQILNE
jgi:hypothetical protein